jgi:hypothetical protein
VLAIDHRTELPPLQTGDYAHFLLHARALIEGRPYSETGYLFTSSNALIGPPSQPPGVPLTIAPIVALDGVHSPLLRWLMVATLGAFLVIAWAALSRHADRARAAGAVLMTGVGIEVTRATVVVNSDVGFAALLWALVWLADPETAWSRGRIAAIVLAGLAAMAYRIAGIVVIPAMILFAIMRPRSERRRALIPAVAWLALPLILLVAGKASVPEGFTYALTGASPLDDVSFKFTTYRRALFESMLYPFPWRVANHFWHVAGVGLVLAGLWRLAPALRRSFLVPLGVAYAAMLAAVTVDEARYVWPFFPLAALALLEGCDVLLARWRVIGRARGLIVAGIPVLLSAAAIGRHLTMPAPPTLLGHPDVIAVLDEVRREAGQAPARVVFMNPRVLTLETGVPAMGFPALAPLPLLRELDRQRITLLVEGDLGTAPPANARLRAAVTRFPQRFALVRQNASFRVYRVLPPAGSTG